MSNKTKVTIIKIGISLLGFAIGAVAGWLFLDWMSHQANQDKVQPCHNGIYSVMDGNTTETVYLEAEDTCKERK